MPQTIFLLTSVVLGDYDSETVLESGAAFATLAGAQAEATKWASGVAEAPLAWQHIGDDRWSCEAAGDFFFLIREQMLGE